jgi:guanylate kinase
MIDDTHLFDVYHPEPLLIVISGPSGVGKDAVLHCLKERQLPFHFVITATTRPPRPGERDGVDYHFLSTPRFEEMIAQDELIEFALVYQQYKGVPKFEVRNAMVSGEDVIMRLDVQGAARVRELCKDAILIFLVPANEAEWVSRLNERQTETPESLSLRMETARKEMTRINEFDYVVVNAQDCLHETADAIIAIIQAEHHRTISRRITL